MPDAYRHASHILETMTDAFVVLNRDWRIIYLNAAAECINRKPRSEVIGKTHWEEWPASVGTNVERQYRQAMAEQTPVHFEHRYYAPPDYDLWLEIHAYPAQDRLEIFYRDITERKQAQIALEQSEARFKLALEATGVIYWERDLSRDVLILSSQFTDPTKPQTVPYQDALNLVHPDDRERVTQANEQAITNLGTFEVEHRLREEKDDTWRWVLARGKVLTDERGNPTRIVGVSLDITDSKQTQVALEESEVRFRRFFDCNMIGMGIWSRSGGILQANDALLNLIGYTRAELEKGQIQWTEITPPEELYLDERSLVEIAEQGFSNPYEKHYIHKDGHRVPILVGGATFADTCDRGVFFVLDQSSRKQTEESLRDSEQRFRQLANTMPQIVWTADASGNLNYVSQQWQDYTGLNLEQTQDREKYLQTIYPDDRAFLFDEWAKSIKTGVPFQAEFRIKRLADGMYRWFLVRAVPINDDQGKITSWYGTSTDIDDRRQAEEALRKSEERLQVALKATQMFVWETDCKTGWAICSEGANEVCGFREGAVARFEALTHPDDLETLQQAIQQAVDTGGTFNLDYRILSPNDKIRWLSTWGSVHRDVNGQPERIIGVSIDITERKQAEAALRQSEERYRYLAESIPQLVWTANGEGKLLDVNQRWSTYTGLSLEQAQTEGWQAIIHPDDIPILSQQWAAAQQNGSHYQAEGRMQRSDGGYRWHLHQAIPLQNDRGEIIKWFGTATDIENQKQLEQQRDRILQQEQAAREEAEAANRIKDEFLAVLSHELRSPLNPILGWTKLLQTRQFSEQEMKRALETIERNVKLQAQLIEDLLDVSRILRGKMALNVSPVDLTTTTQAAIETVRLAAEAKGITLHTSISNDHVQVMGDSVRLQQIVWNLVSNAVKFTPNGGEVSIRLSLVPGQSSLEENKGLMTNDQPPTPQCVQIQVKDTGKGIRPEFLPHLFEYFRQEDSTTTRRFGGLGLGLAIVRYLTEMHGGTVKAESLGEGSGATFTVCLPLLQTETGTSDGNGSLSPTSLDSYPHDQSLPLTGWRILIVDDEADMRELLLTLLEGSGAKVVAASSALEALQALDEFHPAILISDVGMPIVDGYTLIRQVRTRSPARGGAIPAIALTAYAGETDQQQALAAGFHQHLSKPIDPDKLLQAIRALVGQGLGVRG